MDGGDHYLRTRAGPTSAAVLSDIDAFVDLTPRDYQEAQARAVWTFRTVLGVLVLASGATLAFMALVARLLAWLVRQSRAEGGAEELVRRAKQLSTARKQAVETVAHDLKNPLTAAARRMTRLIADVLDHAKIEAGSLVRPPGADPVEPARDAVKFTPSGGVVEVTAAKEGRPPCHHRREHRAGRPSRSARTPLRALLAGGRDRLTGLGSRTGHRQGIVDAHGGTIRCGAAPAMAPPSASACRWSGCVARPPLERRGRLRRRRSEEGQDDGQERACRQQAPGKARRAGDKQADPEAEASDPGPRTAIKRASSARSLSSGDRGLKKGPSISGGVSMRPQAGVSAARAEGAGSQGAATPAR